jgi:hypothetical protein
MKRPPPSFVVEVRRQRRPAGEPVRSWFEEPEAAEAAPSVQAIFAEPSPAPVESAPARPAGRILPSLIEPPPAPDEPPAIKPRKTRSDAGKTSAAKARASKIRAPRRAAPAPHPATPYAPPATPQPAMQAPMRAASDSVKPSRAERHTRILTRYVYGEPKPGESWKRRLQRSDR